MSAKGIWKPVLLLGLVAAMFASTNANTPEWNTQHGRFWMSFCYDGADGWSCHMVYPAAQPTPGENEYLLTRAWNYMARKGGSYLQSTNWTDPEGKLWPYATSGMFRNMNYDYPASYLTDDLAYVWPLGMIRDVRWDHPTVTINDTLEIDFVGPDGVNDTPNSSYPSYGNDPRPPFTTVSDLVTEKKATYSWRYVQGVRLWKEVYSYPYGGPHQDYIIQEVLLTNDGVNGDLTGTLPGTALRAEGPLDQTPDQSVTGVLWWQASDTQSQLAQQIDPSLLGSDQEGMYVQPWPGFDNAAWIKWDIDSPTYDGPDYGDPGDDRWDNLLVDNMFAGGGPLFVSQGPGSDFNTNMTGQPAFRIIYFEKGIDFNAGDYSPADQEGQRAFLTNGALHLPLDESYRTNPLTSAIKDHDRGPTFIPGFGPVAGELNDANMGNHGWTLPRNDSVKVVFVYAAGGIDQEEGRRIGLAWATAKAGGATGDALMAQADIDLYMTGRDSLNKSLNMAYWNYFGEFAPGVTASDLATWQIPNHVMAKPAAYNQAYNVPETPKSPGALKVNVRTGGGEGGIKVAWSKEAEESPLDFDTGVWDFAGYRIYRQAGSRFAPWEMIVESKASNFAVDGDDMRYYYDNATTPGVEYWYSVVAYDDGTQNWAEPGVSLESSRYWLWSGFMPGTGVTPINVTTAVNGARPELALLPNAPNPFNPATTISFTLDQGYENVGLRVYDVLGREVRELNSGALPVGAHQVTWDGLDNSGRAAGTGTYIARLVTPNGTRSIKMLLVR